MAKSLGLILFCIPLLISVASAYQFKVGQSKGWTVPDPNAMSYNQWAERNRFHIGDSLLFVYLPDQDSVLQVDEEAYSTCNTSSYIQKLDDGNTVFTFNRSGAFYFISGVEANCLKNESLVVVVMADRSNRGEGSSKPSLPPSPSPISSPLPPPPPPSSMEVSPSSAPTAEELASPLPPSSSSEVSPSSAPAAEEPTSPPPPPNGASSLGLAGFMGTIGVFLGSLFIL